MKNKNPRMRTVSVTVKPTAADHSFNLFVDIFLVLLLVIIAIPLWSTITLSFRPNDYIGNNLQGMFLAPWKWSTAAYKALLGNAGFLLAFKNSFKILVGGVACALVLTIPLAYVLSITTLPGRRALSILVILPYVFNVGMIPSYLLVTKLGLIDKLVAVFLPGAISTYNCLIMRSFFEGFPMSSRSRRASTGRRRSGPAQGDPAPLQGDHQTIGLFYGVSFWNDFFHAMLYLNSNSLRAAADPAAQYPDGERHERVRGGQRLRRCPDSGHQGSVGLHERDSDGHRLSVHPEVLYQGNLAGKRQGLSPLSGSR